MEWPKLKNIILLILVCLNLCLLFFVAREELQRYYYASRARQEAIQFLANKGVTVAEEAVPNRLTLLPQIVERDMEQEGAVAAQLLGEDLQAQERGAGVYRYSGRKGSLQFHSDGAFSGEFTPGAFPVGADRVKDCLDLLGRLGFDGELREEGADSLTFRQRWKERPLFAQQVTLELEDGCVVGMTAGRRLVGQPTEDPSRSTVTVATALVELFNGINALGDVCSRVDAITEGYVSGTSLSGPMTLTPVWRVATDTGAYQLDLVTGVLTRVI